ncbi:MAG: type I polyketide synthase [Flammeovirgaceae bacterium]
MEQTNTERAIQAIKQLKQQVADLTQQANEPIAIIGMSCRYPGGADDLASYWKLLQEGKDAVKRITRWDADEYYDEDGSQAGKMNTKEAGFLENIDQFDAGFFNITPEEAKNMDPQQRLFLELTWNALEDAGLQRKSLEGSHTGVFIGCMTHDYETLYGGGLNGLNGYVGLGTAASILSGRVSYTFGFKGPSLTLDTACSSSLVALDLACNKLQKGDCSMAIAGGISLILTPALHVEFSKLQGIAKDGRCKTFSNQADGTGWSEGCGVLVLKRLSDAKKDGDKIWAVIKGTAVNQDGKSQGLTAPNGPSQEEVIQQALAKANISPKEVAYVETHGTGTPLGDPIEVQALGNVYGKDRSAHFPLKLGSVKSNLGHTMAAAGVAGVIKTVLALQHEFLPKTLHAAELNEHIPWDQLPVQVMQEAQAWPKSDQKRIASISSFGISGTNSHVVLEEYQETKKTKKEATNQHQLLVLSARNQAGLTAQWEQLKAFIRDDSDIELENIAYSLAKHRSHFNYRMAVECNKKEDLEQVTVPTAKSIKSAKTAVLFTGQGAQYVGMGKELYAQEPTFKAAFDICVALANNVLAGTRFEQDLKAIIFAESDNELGELIHQTQYTQPALFAIEYALFQLWSSWGMKPNFVMGHSIGEIVAATVAGVFNLEDAVKLTVVRGCLMGALPQTGKMISVQLHREEVAKLIQGKEDVLSIAASNTPTQTVLSGQTEACETIQQELEAKGIKCKPLSTSHAFHSPLMEPILNGFEKALASITFNKPKLKLISNSSGKLAGDEILHATYWVNHIREAVSFQEGMQTLAEQGVTTFLEAGPAPVLTAMGMQCLEHANECTWLSSLRKGKSDEKMLLTNLGKWYVAGGKVDWEQFYAHRQGQRIDLPSYPFQRKSYWLEHEAARPFESPLKTDDLKTAWLYETTWEAINLAKSAKIQGNWLILTSNTKTAWVSQLAAALQQAGAATQISDSLSAIQEPLNGVIVLWPSPTDDDTAQQAQDLAVKGLQIFQELIKQDTISIYWLTEGIFNDDLAANQLALAPLWGLGKVFLNEYPHFSYKLIDVDDFSTTDVDQLLQVMTSDDAENQLRITQNQSLALRLHQVDSLPISKSFPNLSQSSILITGGLGGLGLETAHWLAKQQVGQLILMSRRAPNAVAKKEIAHIAALGTKVLALQGDVSDYDSLKNVLDNIPNNYPLKGIIHSAGVLEDAFLPQQNEASFAKVFAAKVAGSWNLHQLTKALHLELFVIYSSMSSILGTAGQANYAAANTFVDQLTHYRNSQGLASQVVNWGTWEKVGMAASLSEETQVMIAKQGIYPIKAEAAFAILKRMLRSEQTQLGVANFNRAPLAQHLENLLGVIPTFFSKLLEVKEKTADSETAFIKTLKSTPELARKGKIIQKLSELLGAILHLEPSELDSHTGLFDLGGDSMKLVEFSNTISKEFGITLLISKTITLPTLDALANHLLENELAFLHLDLNAQLKNLITDLINHKIPDMRGTANEKDTAPLIEEITKSVELFLSAPTQEPEPQTDDASTIDELSDEDFAMKLEEKLNSFD